MKISSKLTLAFFIIVAITAVITTFYSTAAISSAFRDYMHKTFLQQDKEVAADVAEAYRAGGWQEVRKYIEASPRMPGSGLGNGVGNGHGHGMGQMQMMHGRRMQGGMGHFLILDNSGVIVADSNNRETGNSYNLNSGQGTPVMLDGKRLGTVVSDQKFGEMEDAFIDSVRSAGLAAALTALLIALAIAFLFARRFSRPLVALADAVGQMGPRSLSRRVPVMSEDEIGQAAKAFNHMAERLEQNERLRKNMLADVAHELRTPLAILRGNLESLQDGVIAADTETFASLHEETLRMTRLVADLQELALAEAGELQLNREPFSLTDMIEKVSGSLRSIAETRNIRLLVGSAEAVRLIADRQRLEQVLYNLLMNALKYTPTGGQIQIKTWGEEGTGFFSVEDSGKGIAPEDLPYVFERFYRADKSRTRETGGTGLGLAIAQKFVEAHGGTIQVESHPGQGAKLTVRLPLEG